MPPPNGFALGHTMAKQVCSSSKKKDISKWLPVLHMFDMALKVCNATAAEEYEVEAEILFQKGELYLASELGQSL